MLHRSRHSMIRAAGLLVGGLAAMLSVPAVAQAQAPPDTIIFERVGDVPIDANDLTFDSEGVLWAAAADILRLSPKTGTWVEISDRYAAHLLVLHSDTLIGSDRSSTYRSLDRGQTWDLVYDEGGPLHAVSPESAHPGLLLTGTDFGGTGFSYSIDRGATWHEAEVISDVTWLPEAHAFTEIIEGPNQGRLIGGAMNGLFLSDDGGRTWTESSLVENLRYVGQSVVVGADERVRAAVSDATVPGGQLYASGDGATWTHAHTFPYLVLLAAVPGPPEGDGALYAMQTAAAQSGGGVDLYRSYDGATWTLVGTLPGKTVVRFVRDVEIGPDGRLYVAVRLSGSDEEWVYRTTEPVVVSNEPIEVPTEAERAALHVWPNPASRVLHVEAPGADEAVVYDVLGREVLRLGSTAGSVTEADVSGLAPGVYVVRAGGQVAVVTVRR